MYKVDTCLQSQNNGVFSREGGGGLVLSSITCSIGYRYNVSIHKYTTKHPCVYVNRYDSVGLINVNKSMLIRMKLMIYILNRTNQYICTLYVAIS